MTAYPIPDHGRTGLAQVKSSRDSWRCDQTKGWIGCGASIQQSPKIWHSASHLEENLIGSFKYHIAYRYSTAHHIASWHNFPVRHRYIMKSYMFIALQVTSRRSALRYIVRQRSQWPLFGHIVHIEVSHGRLWCVGANFAESETL